MPANAAALRVLIVEDNRDARTTMRMLLSMAYGHTVHEAGDGATGIQIAIEEHPDVALIDLGLPDLDGCEVARRIRAGAGEADGPTPPIVLVALTGYASDDDRRRAAAAGFDRYLVKPVEASSLLGIFDEIVRSKQIAGIRGRNDQNI